MTKHIHIIVFFLYLLLPAEIFSQPATYIGWYFLNPLPTADGLSVIRFVNPNTGFAVGDKLVTKTTNGGANWYLDYSLINQLQTEQGNSSRFSSIAFSDNNTCYLAGARYLLKSTNLGASWFNIEQIAAGIYAKFFNSQTGYIVGTVEGKHISKTSNSGLNWYTTLIGNDYILSSDFINASTGYAVGWATGAIGVILKTTNGGSNWTKDTISNNNFYGVQFTSNDTGYICGANKIYKTTNAGLNWFMVFYKPWEQFTSLFFINSSTGYVGNFNIPGTLYKTTNGGMNWQVSLARESGFGTIFFINIDTGYVAAGDVLKTTNAGATWLSQQHDFTGKKSFFQTLDFIDQNTGFGGDDYGQIFKTSDAGNNWVKVRDTSGTELPPRVEDIHFVNSQTGFAVGDERMLLKTTNGGINWLHQNAGVTSNYIYYSLYFSDALTGYIAGTEWNHGPVDISVRKNELYSLGQGHIILKTTNGGANWYVKDSTSDVNSNLYSIGFKDANTGYAAGSTKIYRTTNSGENWSVSNDLIEVCRLCQLCKILFINSSTGFIAGFSDNDGSGVMYRTTNGGINWVNYNTIAPWYIMGLYSVDFTDQYTGYASGMGGTLIKTTNTGGNWFRLSANFNADIADISFTSTNTGYAVGYAGLVMKTTTGGGNPIGMSPISNSVPEKYYLHQNYPNPFNPTTKIRFSIPTPLYPPEGGKFGGNVTLKIYDILGRETAVLVDEALKPGEYEVEWDGSTYASGVYFYQLVTGDPSTGSGHGFVQTRKMVLMK